MQVSKKEKQTQKKREDEINEAKEKFKITDEELEKFESVMEKIAEYSCLLVDVNIDISMKPMTGKQNQARAILLLATLASFSMRGENAGEEILINLLFALKNNKKE